MATGQNKRKSRNIIGKRIKEARQRHRPPLTQDALSGKLAAQGLQLDRVAIAKIETGFRSAFDFEVKSLAAALAVDANWLLGIEAGTKAQKSRAASGRRARV